MIDLIKIFAEDRSLIPYRPRLNIEIGRVTATILLQQVIYWFYKSGQKPFFKFKGPCSHKLYKKGDSWIEELGFTRSEFDTALKQIGEKLSKKTINQEHDKFVEYWTTPNRETYYQIHKANLCKLINRLYEKQESDFTKSGNDDLVEKQESDFTKSGNDDLYNTETTTENKITTEKFNGEIKYIIDFLNNETGQNYRSSTEVTRKLIKARLNDGFSVKDFESVIKYKSLEWGKDDSFKVYLRPQTLFGTKFESYLNQSALFEKKNKPSYEDDYLKNHSEYLDNLG